MTMTETETHDAEMTPWRGHWRCSCGYVGTEMMMNRHMAEVGWCPECWGSGSSNFGARTGICWECGGSGEALTGTARFCDDCRRGGPCYDHDAAYRLHCDEELAIHEGLATRLVHCYLCFLEETGKPDMSPKQDQGPLRGVITTGTAYGFNRAASLRVGFDGDPYEVLKLNCGHGLI